MHVPVNKNNEQKKEPFALRFNFVSLLLTVALALSGAVAGYFATIYGIKIDLVSKAESEAVVKLEKRVLSLEFYLKEKMLTKDEFYLFQNELTQRLDKIKY